MFSLEGKTIIITGGATHLGKAMSESICQFGGNVIICSRNVKRNIEYAEMLNKQYLVKCVGAYLNICDEVSVNELFLYAIKEYKTVDVLINNATFSKPDYIESQQYNDFMQGLEGTIGGAFNTTKKALKIMMKQNHGNIINISSMYGLVSPNPDMYRKTQIPPNPSNYGCGKAAVIQFTKYLACNYATYGIRANCIAPGAFPSPDVQENVQFIENIKEKNPMKRIGVPDDLKGITVFLASEASSYITGQCINVDGGWTAW